VAIPKRRDLSFRHLEFLRLSDRRVLLIMVTPGGDVQNRMLHTDRGYTQVELTEATNFLNQHFAGKPLHEVRARLAAELRSLREDIAALMTAAVEAGEGALNEAEGVVVAGERNLLSGELVGNVDRLKRLFEMFERKTSLIHLLDVSQRSQGVQIYIGGESGLVPLDEMSVVTAPYEVDGRVIGTLGVIGPTRMAYERVIPIVDVTAKLLSNALDKQLAD
jgi:heat-inducible transcriptional repressor